MPTWSSVCCLAASVEAGNKMHGSGNTLDWSCNGCVWQMLKQRHRHCPYCNLAQNKNQTKFPSPNSATNGIRRGNLSMTSLPLWSAMCCIYREKKNPRDVLRLNLPVLWCFSNKYDILQWRGNKGTYILSVLRCIIVQLFRFIFSVWFDYFSFSLF